MSTEPASTTDSTETSPGFATVVRAVVVMVRARPSSLVPFLLAGLVGAASTLARIETPYPASISPFGASGSLQIPIPLVPRLEPTVELAPTILLGLRLEYAAALIGWQAALAVVTAVAFAVGIWRVAPRMDGFVPPAARVGWLAVYVLVLQSVLFGVIYVVRVHPTGGVVGTGILAALVALLVGGALLLAPAAIVLGGDRPDAAVLESLAYAGSRPFSSAGLVLCLGILATLFTGAATVVSGYPGLAAGTIASVAVAGTAHAAAVASIYESVERNGPASDS
ncbi:hypothetical protein [Natronobacterium texcoconense]|uniref:Uncharacterized protein n=1 Tax=Natronobacterium texcoconense TaxID=1095778 RepID=A0A1H1A4Q8_NATTX|nr:hypothetical protein [Natronobacterium texcoconense]SDQ34637.1 hypothetical protein SAMN04489842_0565 [Natronobacterium texcoconense]